jgi:hypothetical protein
MEKKPLPNDSNNTQTNMSDIADDIEVVPISVPRRKIHPVVNASINNFIVKDDGQEVFIVDGKEYNARSVGVDNLRRFVSKNKVKSSIYPHRSLSRDGQLTQIIAEISLMKARRDNGEPDPWLKEKSKKATEPKKKPSTNRYRLANVIFSESVRPAVLQYGRALTKDHLESNLKTNQKIYELVALLLSNTKYRKGP